MLRKCFPSLPKTHKKTIIQEILNMYILNNSPKKCYFDSVYNFMTQTNYFCSIAISEYLVLYH